MVGDQELAAVFAYDKCVDLKPGGCWQPCCQGSQFLLHDLGILLLNTST